MRSESLNDGNIIRNWRSQKKSGQIWVKEETPEGRIKRPGERKVGDAHWDEVQQAAQTERR